ncbi:kunitz-type protease inhibitor 1a [Corythoichthys intestinalis]|uniref:kunitz-type protease inhibitor 1a n=1 Tax=Corythoichthys intestinalis TaxID=161448 RepID=UPI0025A60F27|nr:kunitz-type protease inhibitor 1a [Corythoichthys intestinalis]XP_061798695.1 kunitz-type protease inhibitor 1-like [Nerophis lumbriciformis]
MYPCLPVLLLILWGRASGQATGEDCLAQFKKGREGFVLDADESVKDGATFISSPQLNGHRDCVAACCKEPKCNVALMEGGSEENAIKSCFLFDCLYKKKYVCRFVRKKGYYNYILDSVYESYLEIDVPPKETDRPPVANGGQDRVVQPQDRVTLNGLESKDDQGIASYMWKMLTEYPYAVIEKTNFPDQIIVSNLTSGMYKFQLTVTDTIGQSDSTKVTVLVLTAEQSEHHCMAPKKIGPCRGAFPRWHYNAASEKCEEFVFGGCRENLNNYLSKDECTNACYGTEKRGSSRGLPLPDQKEKCGVACTAEQFTCANGCCLEPGLECDSTAQCSDGSDEQKCNDLDNTFQILLQIPVDEQKVRCTEPPHTGSCRDTLTKWYYNPLHQDCFRFNFGGCQGNENRFDRKEACMKFCRGVTEKDVFARKQEFERRVADSQTGVIAIAAVLAIAIVILLGILLYCFMKGKKKSSQHHRVPVNNAPLTTMEDREHLVYNSTTKPI